MSRVSLFVVSGIIGVGKSFFMDAMAKDSLLERKTGKTILFVKEPVEEWVKNGWLGSFMKDPQNTALAFQTLVFFSHTVNIEAVLEYAPSDTVIVMERCLYDQYIFWSAQADRTTILEREAYHTMWKWRHEKLPPIKGIIHLKTSTLDVANERIKQRNRQLNGSTSESSVVDTAYQQVLQTKHDAWFTSPVTSIPEELTARQFPCLSVQTDSYEPEVLAETIAHFINEE